LEENGLDVVGRVGVDLQVLGSLEVLLVIFFPVLGSQFDLDTAYFRRKDDGDSQVFSRLNIEVWEGSGVADALLVVGGDGGVDLAELAEVGGPAVEEQLGFQNEGNVVAGLEGFRIEEDVELEGGIGLAQPQLRVAKPWCTATTWQSLEATVEGMWISPLAPRAAKKVPLM